jgi:hypothetical protein
MTRLVPSAGFSLPSILARPTAAARFRIVSRKVQPARGRCQTVIPSGEVHENSILAVNPLGCFNISGSGKTRPEPGEGAARLSER